MKKKGYTFTVCIHITRYTEGKETITRIYIGAYIGKPQLVCSPTPRCVLWIKLVERVFFKIYFIFNLNLMRAFCRDKKKNILKNDWHIIAALSTQHTHTHVIRSFSTWTPARIIIFLIKERLKKERQQQQQQQQQSRRIPPDYKTI